MQVSPRMIFPTAPRHVLTFCRGCAGCTWPDKKRDAWILKHAFGKSCPAQRVTVVLVLRLYYLQLLVSICYDDPSLRHWLWLWTDVHIPWLNAIERKKANLSLLELSMFQLSPEKNKDALISEETVCTVRARSRQVCTPLHCIVFARACSFASFLRARAHLHRVVAECMHAAGIVGARAAGVSQRRRKQPSAHCQLHYEIAAQAVHVSQFGAAGD